MSFTTYENRNNPHISIHRESCNQIEKRGGVHLDGQEHYKKHRTYFEAKKYAKSRDLPIKDCSFCNPDT